LDVENKINDNIKPLPDYTLEVNERTKVVTLSVKGGNYKPYFYKSKAYKRNDTATIEADGFELKRLILEGENLSYEELIKLNFFNDKLANELINQREIKPFESLSEIEDTIFYGFSSHFKNRVLSILETRINADMISEYINNYPSTVRVLDYKNEEVLEEFKEKVFSNEKNYVSNIDVCDS
jgi:predicted nucleotidyltransferase